MRLNRKKKRAVSLLVIAALLFAMLLFPKASRAETGGHIYRIRIHKSDSVTGMALPGATFQVIRVTNGKTVGEITTDSNGVGELDGLLKDSYLLVETNAPFGYQTLGAAVGVGAESFNDDNLAEVYLTNDAIRCRIPVKKEWVGEVAEQVTIRLLADGVVVQEMILSADNRWQGAFADLPRYDFQDGHEILYDVQEAPLEGYEGEREGSQERGFVFTNTRKAEEPGTTPPPEPTPTPDPDPDPTPDPDLGQTPDPDPGPTPDPSPGPTPGPEMTDSQKMDDAAVNKVEETKKDEQMQQTPEKTKACEQMPEKTKACEQENKEGATRMHAGAVKTGDQNRIKGWCLLLIAAACVVIVLLYKKKDKSF